MRTAVQLSNRFTRQSSICWAFWQGMAIQSPMRFASCVSPHITHNVLVHIANCAKTPPNEWWRMVLTILGISHWVESWRQCADAICTIAPTHSMCACLTHRSHAMRLLIIQCHAHAPTMASTHHRKIEISARCQLSYDSEAFKIHWSCLQIKLKQKTNHTQEIGHHCI